MRKIGDTPLTPAEKMRRHRDRKRAIEAGATAQELRWRVLADTDPALAIAEWSEATLKVPAGHPLAGGPMRLPAYATVWLRESLAPGCRESLLCMARKNAKSSVCAIYALSTVCGPLKRPGFRGAVCSINAAKAGELIRQCEEIAIASGLQIAARVGHPGLFFRSRPNVGIETADGVTFEVLAADKTAGHSSGFSTVLVDETGLLQERDRPLLSGLRSSTSARDGKVLHITIRGDGPHVPELIERRNDAAVVVHVYEPPEGSDPCDPETWEYGNPGLAAGIKSRSYMVDRARFCANVPGDLGLFAAEDCNLEGSVSRMMICSVGDWRKLLTGEPPRRAGMAVVGFDAGSTDSLTAAAVIWPDTGRMEVYAACGVSDDHTLIDRGRGDQVGSRYLDWQNSGELWTYANRRVTPLGEFMRDLAGTLDGAVVWQVGCDRFRKGDLLDALSDAGLHWAPKWRGVGAGTVADGSADVMAFQRAVKIGWLRPVIGRALMLHAISESTVTLDVRGNMAVAKDRHHGRIDPLQAAVIAAGLAERLRNKPRVKYRSLLIGDAA